MTLVFALSYGGRAEIVDAARRLLRDAEQGKLDPEQLDEKTFAAYLYEPELPDPDLLIRTGGEQRVSNFLLWQIAYAEIFATAVMWPDFRKSHLVDALLDYQQRERRFGLTGAQARSGGEPSAREAARDPRQHRAASASRRSTWWPRFPERFRVVALAAGRNVEKLARAGAPLPARARLGRRRRRWRRAARAARRPSASRSRSAPRGCEAVAAHPADLVRRRAGRRAWASRRRWPRSAPAATSRSPTRKCW